MNIFSKTKDVFSEFMDYFNIEFSTKNFMLFLFFTIVLFSAHKGFYDILLIVARIEIFVLILQLIGTGVLFYVGFHFHENYENILFSNTFVKKKLQHLRYSYEGASIFVIIIFFLKSIIATLFFIWGVFLIKDLALAHSLDLEFLKPIAWKFFFYFLFNSIRTKKTWFEKTS